MKTTNATTGRQVQENLEKDRKRSTMESQGKTIDADIRIRIVTKGEMTIEPIHENIMEATARVTSQIETSMTTREMLPNIGTTSNLIELMKIRRQETIGRIIKALELQTRRI